MRIVRLGLAACLLTTCAIAAQEADPFEPGWDTQRRQWSGRLGARDDGEPARLRLINEFGDIRARSSDNDEVDVRAVVQRRRDVEAPVELHVSEDADGILIEVRFPEAAIDRDLLLPGRPPDRRVDVAIFVPVGATFDARTVTGLLEARGLSGDARLRSESGDLVVRTSGSLDASTEHGSVRAQFLTSEWTTPPRIETTTGDIRVEVPRSTNATGHLETRFEITTDYSIEIEREGLLKTGRATIGEGGPEIVLHSHKGAVKLLEAIE